MDIVVTNKFKDSELIEMYNRVSEEKLYNKSKMTFRWVTNVPKKIFMFKNCYYYLPLEINLIIDNEETILDFHNDKNNPFNKLGSGSYGSVFLYKNRNTNEKYAVKINIFRDKSNRVSINDKYNYWEYIITHFVTTKLSDYINYFVEIKNISSLINNELYGDMDALSEKINRNYHNKKNNRVFKRTKNMVTNKYLPNMYKKCSANGHKNFIVMKFMKTMDNFGSYFYDGTKLNYDRLINFLLQMFKIFKYLKKNGLVYNDFKLENVLYFTDSNGIDQFRLGDLGSLRFMNQLYPPVISTPQISPPKTDNNSQSIFPNDVYSLGMVIMIIYFRIFIIINRKSSKSWVGDWESSLNKRLDELITTNHLEYLYNDPLFNLIKNRVLVTKDKRCLIEEFESEFKKIYDIRNRNNTKVVNMRNIRNNRNFYSNSTPIPIWFNNRQGGSQFINVPNHGKRKIRYQKNGKPYVIVKGKKIKI